jgi:hypothetical protein
VGWGDLGVPAIDNSLYDIQYNEGFSDSENNQIKSIKYINKVHSELTNLDHKDAFNRFTGLDKDLQDSLYALYGNQNEYMTAPTSGFQSFLTGAWDFVKSPFTRLFDLVGEYAQAANTIPNVIMMSAVNGDNFWDGDTWSRAYNNGEALYNNELDRQLTAKYGKEQAYVAKKILEGYLPGEIAAMRGNLNQEFLEALTASINNAEEWGDGILEDFRQAKLSAGREFARSVLGVRSGKGDPDDETFTFLSGLTDAAFTIFTDPLTYITAGAGKGVMFAGAALNKQAKIFKAAQKGNVGEIFKFKEVRNYWDGYLGEVSKLRSARATVDDTMSGELASKISRMYPEHGTAEDVEIFLKATIQRYDPQTDEFFDDFLRSAADAEEYFQQGFNASKLLMGRTSDTTYFRDSIAVAKRSRAVSMKLKNAWYQLGSSGLKSEEKGRAVNAAVNELKDLGKESDFAVKVDTPTLAYFKKAETGLNKLAKAFSLSAGDNAIAHGESTAKSLEVFKAMAQHLMPKDIADSVGEVFLRSTQEERIAIMRGLTRGILESYGIDKLPEGRQLIDNILTSRFGSERGMLVSTEVRGRHDWGVSPDDMLTNGPIHSFQLANAFANFPWQEVLSLSNDVKFKTGGKGNKWRALHTVGGAVNGTMSSKLGTFWSFFTLAPRLGIRSAIDESFMLWLTAPRDVLVSMLPGRFNQAKMASRALTAFTGNEKTMGAFSQAFRKTFGKAFTATTGKTVENSNFLRRLDPANAISSEERHKLFYEVLAKYSPDGEAGLPDEMMEELMGMIGYKAVHMYENLKPQAMADVTDLARFGYSSIGSAESSVARATGLNATIDNDLRVAFSGESALTRATKQFKLEFGDFQDINPSALSNQELTMHQYVLFYNRMFASKVGDISLGYMFLKNNGLRTADDFSKAVEDTLIEIYKREDAEQIIRNEVAGRAGTFASKDVAVPYAPMSDEEILRRQIRTALMDINYVFHGGDNAFNDKLFNEVVKAATDSTGQMTKASYRYAMEQFNIGKFAPLVTDNLIKNTFKSNIMSMKGFENSYKAFYSKYGDKAWEVMDRTLTSMTRQPTVMAYYLKYRGNARELENRAAADFYLNEVTRLKIKNPPSFQDALEGSVKVTEQVKGALMTAQNIAARQATEYAMNNAINQTLKYVDNPHVRTNIASSIRNVNRFYRATEDFWRRLYRLKDVSSRTMYRTRLLHSGLVNTGMLETDEQGNEYFVLPMDNIIFSGLDPVLRTLSGGTGFYQPQFNRFTVRFTAINPSFQEGATIPTLSGPTAAVSVLALKSIAGQFGSNGKEFAEKVDNFLLGDIGDNLTLQKAVVPATLAKVWNILDTNAKSQANASAILSAIAYNQAHVSTTGVIHPGMLPDASPRERADYMNQLRISGHNLNVMRSLMGIFSPFSVNTQESVDLPEYWRDNGAISLKGIYTDILSNVLQKYGADVSDPFELANALFVGENPDKLVYTVSREDSNIKALLRRTDEVQSWLFQNKGFTDAYGQAAYFFAPQHGDINLSMYNWMKAAELYENADMEEFLTRVQVARDKALYFQIGDKLDEDLKNVSDYYRRRELIDLATQQREGLKMQNPYLADELAGDDVGIGGEKEMLTNVERIVSDYSAPISAGERDKLRTALTIFNRGYSYITNPMLQNLPDYSVAKGQMRDTTLENLYDIAASDPVLRQLIQNIFAPILRFHARNTPSASPLVGGLIDYGNPNA